MRVLHLPTSVGGNSWWLSRGERALGLESDVLVSHSNWLNYPADISLNLESTNRIEKLLRLGSQFLKHRSKYDVFHFNHGSSLIHSPLHHLVQADLPFYPDKAKLFVTYNGCDVRQKDRVIKVREIAPCHNPNCYGGVCNSGQLDKWRRVGVDKMAQFVEHMWALNPDLLHFLPAEKSSFLPYSIGNDSFSPCLSSVSGRLKVLHAPTNREAKGSDHFFQALERLKMSHGDCVELILVENVPNKDAIELYKSADVVVDQLLIGWYGGLAVEAMLLGKPVIVRIDKNDLCFIPDEMAKELNETVISADPASIYDALVWCVENRFELRRLGESGAAYARRWHDPKYVASITKSFYEKT